MKIEEKYSWDDLLEMETGKIIEDWYESNIRCLIMRGPSSLCAYFGIPDNHPLANFDYDSIPLDCHGGLTFADKGDGKIYPKNYYWYGWDYSHCNDYSFYYDKYPSNLRDNNDKKWMVAEVKNEIENVLYDFKRLVDLAERIYNKKLK